MSRKINRMKQIHQTILFIFCVSKEPKDQINEANTSNNIFVSRKEPKDQSNEANTSNDICSQRNDLSGEAMCDRLVPAAKKNAEAKRRPNRSVLMMMMCQPTAPCNSQTVLSWKTVAAEINSPPGQTRTRGIRLEESRP